MTYAATFARLRQLSGSPVLTCVKPRAVDGHPAATRSTTMMTRSSTVTAISGRQPAQQT